MVSSFTKQVVIVADTERAGIVLISADPLVPGKLALDPFQVEALHRLEIAPKLAGQAWRHQVIGRHLLGLPNQLTKDGFFTLFTWTCDFTLGIDTGDLAIVSEDAERGRVGRQVKIRITEIWFLKVIIQGLHVFQLMGNGGPDLWPGRSEIADGGAGALPEDQQHSPLYVGSGAEPGRQLGLDDPS